MLGRRGEVLVPLILQFILAQSHQCIFTEGNATNLDQHKLYKRMSSGKISMKLCWSCLMEGWRMNNWGYCRVNGVWLLIQITFAWNSLSTSQLTQLCSSIELFVSFLNSSSLMYIFVRSFFFIQMLFSQKAQINSLHTTSEASNFNRQVQVVCVCQLEVEFCSL